MRLFALISCLVLTVLCANSQAETGQNFGVCENCVLVRAELDYFAAYYPGDYEGYAYLTYQKPVLSRSDMGQKVEVSLSTYACRQPRFCYPELKSDSDLTFLDATDPIVTNQKNVKASINVAGMHKDQDCYLGQTPDPDGQYGYSYKNGVNVYCLIGLENQTAMYFNFYFRRDQK